MGYNKLEAEKNKAIATLRTTIEERNKEREAEKRREEENKEVENAMRELCKSIISKRDMNSSTDKSLLLKTGATSYNKLSMQKLINEAKKARKEYDESRTNLMKELHRENSDLKLETANLKEHQKINEEAMRIKAEEIHKLKKELIDIGNSSKNKTNKNVKTNINNVSLSPKEKERTIKIIAEADLLAEKNQNKKLKEITNNLQQKKSGKKTATDKEKEIEKISESLSENGILNERAKLVFGVIGRTGASLTNDIKRECIKHLVSINKKITEEEATKYLTNLDVALKKLISLGLLSTGTFQLNTTVRYYEMTAIGNAVFFHIEKKEAEPSHFSRVTAAHSSPKHGYGIVEIANIMRKYPSRFINVSEFNKEKSKSLKTHIEVNGEVVTRTIEPDIIFDEKFKNEPIEERYIEYELVSQEVEDYFDKIEKYIMRGTKKIFFIFPNETLQKTFKRIIRQYLENKLKHGIDFSDINFYLYTTGEFSSMCESNINWKATNIFEDIKTESKETITEEETNTFTDRTSGKSKYKGTPKRTSNEEKAAAALLLKDKENINKMFENTPEIN